MIVIVVMMWLMQAVITRAPTATLAGAPPSRVPALRLERHQAPKSIAQHIGVQIQEFLQRRPFRWYGRICVGAVSLQRAEQSAPRLFLLLLMCRELGSLQLSVAMEALQLNKTFRNTIQVLETPLETHNHKHW
jgi:hypothetical protein